MARNLPNGKQQFIDLNGNPVALGSVLFYIPTTTTFKTTWQDAAKSAANTNPVLLDAGGYAVIWGEGLYRQILRTAAGVVVWDQEVSSGEGAQGVSWGGQGSGTGNAQIVTVPGFTEVDGNTFEYRPGATNSGAATIVVNGGVARPVLAMGPLGPIALTGSELIAGNVYRLVWVDSLGGYVIANTTSTTFNSLITATEINEEDFAPFYKSDVVANRKILLVDWLTSLIFGLANQRTSPELADLLQIYNSTDDRVDKIAVADIFKIVAKLDLADKDVDVNDYQILLVSLADGTLKRSSILRGIGPWRWRQTLNMASGDSAAVIRDVGNVTSLRVTLERAVPVDDDNRLQLAVSKDAGVTWENTDYLNTIDATNVSSMWVGTDGAGDRVGNGVNGGGLNGVFILSSLSSNASKTLSGAVAWKKPSDAVNSCILGAQHKTGDTVDALRLKWSTGAWRRGKITVEGILD